MEHEGNRPHRDSEDERQGDEQDGQLGSRIGIQPKMPILLPPTVLVTELDNGTLIVQGRPDGPRVWLEPDQAVPLKRELAAAFERFELAAAGDEQDRTP